MIEIDQEKYPLVTVYIPTKNRSSLLKRAIESCINQTYPNLEIIVVDDGSTDDTPQILKSYSESVTSLLYIRNDQSLGACQSRNMALKMASGTYVTGLDDDDYFLPTRIETLVNNFDDKYSFYCTHFKQSGLLAKMKAIRRKEIAINLSDLLFENVVGNQIFTLKERVLEIEGYDVELTACQDYDLWLRMVIKFGDAYKLKSESLVFDESASNNRITNSKKAFLGYLRCYNKYSSRMNDRQRANWLETIRRIQGKLITFKFLLTLMSHLGIFVALRRYIGNRRMN